MAEEKLLTERVQNRGRSLIAGARSEWPLDAEGYPHRQAARVVPYTETGKIFLVKGHDFGKPDRAWWFTVGGGKSEVEDGRAAAIRELQEETGLVVAADRLEGPVLYRKSTFHFYLETRRQDEEFFLLLVDDTEAEILTRGQNRSLTPEEEEVLEESRWWDISELARQQEEGEVIYPCCLPELARRWVEDRNYEAVYITEA